MFNEVFWHQTVNNKSAKEISNEIGYWTMSGVFNLTQVFSTAYSRSTTK